MMVKTNFSAYLSEDASPTKNYTRTAVSSYTAALATANSEYDIEFDPIELGEGWDCVGVGFSDPSGNDIITVTAILDMKVCGETPPNPYTN
jgi:hypothetical protein